VKSNSKLQRDQALYTGAIVSLGLWMRERKYTLKNDENIPTAVQVRKKWISMVTKHGSVRGQRACLDTLGSAQAGGVLGLYPCHDSNGSQAWTHRVLDEQLRGGGTSEFGLCLAPSKGNLLFSAKFATCEASPSRMEKKTEIILQAVKSVKEELVKAVSVGGGCQQSSFLNATLLGEGAGTIREKIDPQILADFVDPQGFAGQEQQCSVEGKAGSDGGKGFASEEGFTDVMAPPQKLLLTDQTSPSSLLFQPSTMADLAETDLYRRIGRFVSGKGDCLTASAKPEEGKSPFSLLFAPCRDADWNQLFAWQKPAS